MTTDGALHITTSEAHKTVKINPKLMKNFIHRYPCSKFCGMLKMNFQIYNRVMAVPEFHSEACII